MNFKNVNILIVGDVMLDQYWFGDTARISPEAPVPVVKVNTVDKHPGGAANVAACISALNATPYLLGVVGEDEQSQKLKSLLDKVKVTHVLESISNHNTITKLRVLSRNQQMIRLDTEKPFHLTENFIHKFRQKYLECLEGMDAVILSDYLKGTLIDAPWFIQKANEKKIPIIVDPKASDFSVYRGATVLTPNKSEFEKVAGICDSEEILLHKARAILDHYEIENLLITRSEQGMSVVSKYEITHVPSLAREVHDVTGAGDTVVAVLATALASQIPLIKAATLSNIAAGIAVSKLGAATVTLAEIQSFLHSSETFLPEMPTEEIVLQEIQKCRERGEKIIFTNGCFDILHAGHVSYLNAAKKLGGRLCGLEYRCICETFKGKYSADEYFRRPNAGIGWS